MSRELITASTSSTIFDVMELMVAKNVGRAIITENEIPVGIFTERDVLKRVMIKKDTGCIVVMSHGKPKGIFTERDVLKRVATKKIDTKKTPIQKVTTTDLVTLPHTSLIGRILEEMYKRGFRHMVILGDQKELVGIVAMRDILKYAKALDVDERVRSTWKEIEAFWESEEHYTPG